jgi:hypothetical protein
MDFLLLAVALLVLMVGGAGLTLLLLPNGLRTGTPELFALSFLFGSAVVSALSFVFGFLVSGTYLRWTVASSCVSLGLAGLWRRGWPVKPREVLPADGAGWLLLALNAIQISAVARIGFGRVLGWDGLFNFESKARLAFLNGGAIPIAFFSDPTRTWMLQSYPLLLPLAESWLYLWLGRADQELVKIIFELFFVAALCLLRSGSQRFGIAGWRKLVAPFLLFIAPLLLIGDGSTSSGYADFPLAVFYLAAVIWVAEFWRSGDGAALRLAGVLLAAACWLKQEGAILWLTAVLIVAFRIWFGEGARRRWRSLAALALPGAAVLAGWQAFVRWNHSLNVSQFSPLRFSTLRANLPRVPANFLAVGGEFANWRHWGAFWLIAVGVTVMAWRSTSRDWKMLPLFVLLPAAVYSGVYIFSLWPSFLTHLESSFPRLLVHVTMVAVWLVGVSLEAWRKLPASPYTNLLASNHCTAFSIAPSIGLCGRPSSRTAFDES